MKLIMEGLCMALLGFSTQVFSDSIANSLRDSDSDFHTTLNDAEIIEVEDLCGDITVVGSKVHSQPELISNSLKYPAYKIDDRYNKHTLIFDKGNCKKVCPGDTFRYTPCMKIHIHSFPGSIIDGEVQGKTLRRHTTLTVPAGYAGKIKVLSRCGDLFVKDVKGGGKGVETTDVVAYNLLTANTVNGEVIFNSASGKAKSVHGDIRFSHSTGKAESFLGDIRFSHSTGKAKSVHGDIRFSHSTGKAGSAHGDIRCRQKSKAKITAPLRVGIVSDKSSDCRRVKRLRRGCEEVALRSLPSLLRPML